MLVNLLGARDYVAWTKEARVRFLRQARTDLTARVVLTDEEVQAVRAELEITGKVERQYLVELVDARGHVCAACDITVHLHARRTRTEPANIPKIAAAASH